MGARKNPGADGVTGSYQAALSKDVETRLIAAAQAGDESAGWELVQAHNKLWASMAREAALKNPSVPKDDYLQEARTAALLAIDTFDPDRGIRFSTYAFNEVRTAINRLGSVPFDTQEYDAEATEEGYAAFVTGQAPRTGDGAHHATAAGIVNKAGVIRNDPPPDSADQPLDERDRPATDYWPPVALRYINNLPDDDKAIALGLWDQFPPKSQSELARELGINRSTVSRAAGRLQGEIERRFGGLYFGNRIENDGLRSDDDDLPMQHF